VHHKPRSVLIVGCGAGVTAGSFVVHPDIERIVICELEPLIPQKVATYFEDENHAVVKDKRVKIVYDDARHYILTTREKFDVITSDPIHPWVKGAAVLYTREYFELCKRRLNPGGVITQWVPLYESNAAAVKSEVATFFEVFPEGSVWGNDQGGYGYDTVLLGQVDPLQIDVDELVEAAATRGPSDGGRVPERGRAGFGSGFAFHFCRQRERPQAVAGRCGNQSRPESAAAVSRRPGVQQLQRRGHLSGNARPPHVSPKLLRGIRSQHQRIETATCPTDTDTGANSVIPCHKSMIALTHQPSPNMQACQRTFVPVVPIDAELAAKQHQAYCQALTDCGAAVRVLDVNLPMPDGAFIEDTAVVLDEVAILCSMGTPSRKTEPVGIEPVLREYRPIERIVPPATLEGGDVLRIGRRLLVGHAHAVRRSVHEDCLAPACLKARAVAVPRLPTAPVIIAILSFSEFIWE